MKTVTQIISSMPDESPNEIILKRPGFRVAQQVQQFVQVFGAVASHRRL